MTQTLASKCFYTSSFCCIQDEKRYNPFVLLVVFDNVILKYINVFYLGLKFIYIVIKKFDVILPLYLTEMLPLNIQAFQTWFQKKSCTS